MSELLEQNVKQNLKNNEYPGRGIVIGANSSGTNFVQVYWIMGRSPNSQNRIFVNEDGIIKTHPFDESKVEDPSLIIYNALRQSGNNYIVSNGDQTDTVYDFLQKGEFFESALATRTFEPDEPNYTPRISGLIVLDKQNPVYKLNILKAEDNDPERLKNITWDYKEFVNGIGHCFHTYKANGNPLPPFAGDPYQVPLAESIDDVMEFFWNNLNEENRISLAVKFIEKNTGNCDYRIINKHQ